MKYLIFKLIYFIIQLSNLWLYYLEDFYYDICPEIKAYCLVSFHLIFLSRILFEAKIVNK